MPSWLPYRVMGTLLLLSSSAYADDLLTTVKLAQNNDAQLLAQQYQFSADQNNTDLAKSAFLPQINGSADYRVNTAERNQVNTDDQYAQLAVQLNQTIYDKRNYLNLDQARAGVAISEAQLQQVQQQTLFRGAQAYFNILSAQANLTFTRAQTQAIERQLTQAKNRYEVGLIPITDVHEAQASYDTAIANDIIAENLLNIRWEELVEITQQRPSQLSDIHNNTFNFADMSLPIETWIQRATEHNLALKVSQLQTQISKLDVQSAKAGHYPTVSLSSQYAADDSVQESRSGEIKVQVAIPIYSGGATQTSIQQAHASLNQVQERQEQTLRTLVRNVRSAYLNLQAAKSSVTASEQAVKSNQSAFEATQAGFDVGSRNIVDVLISTQNLYRAKQNLAESRYQYLMNYLNLHLVSGTLDLDAIQHVNQLLQ